MLVISEADNASSHQLAVGEELLLRLPENPTTGYRWQLTQIGRGKLRLVNDRFETSAPGGRTPLPGAAGHRLFHFAAESSGEVRLEMVEKRGGTATTPDNRQATFSIVVR